MNKIYYIAKRIHRGKSEDKKVSRPIVRISRWSIIIAVAVNIITLAVVTGFQNTVKDKVIGFGAHVTIVKAGEENTFETSPIVYNDSLVHLLENVKGVKDVLPFAYKPALLQSDPDTNWYNINGIDTFQVQQEIHGIIVKGVGKDYNWDFFKYHLIKGRLPNVSDTVPHQEIILSADIANDLNIQVMDDISIFFVKAVPVKLRYKVCGIFKTGLQELDEQIVVGDIRNVQKLNDWGIQTSIRVADTITKDGQFIIYSETTGGNGNYRYDWGRGYENAYGFTYCPVKDTTIRLITSDYYNYIDGYGEQTAIPDTAYIRIHVEGKKYLPCFPKNKVMGKIQRDFLNESGTKFSVAIKGGKRVFFEYIDGKGSQYNYIGGYEITVNNFDQLNAITTNIKKSILFQNSNSIEHYSVRNIKEEQKDIFLWLDFLNINVIIILVLMLLIGTINMGSGLLVLIITKTQLIGLLKAIGTKNWEIRKLFLYQAFFILFRGIIIGNIIGLGICFLQKYFNLIPLNPEVYYLSTVPIEINVWAILLLNIGTIILCTAVLIIPSYVTTRISPVKALKFD